MSESISCSSKSANLLFLSGSHVVDFSIHVSSFHTTSRLYIYEDLEGQPLMIPFKQKQSSMTYDSFRFV